jgi:hypothetical protein
MRVEGLCTAASFLHASAGRNVGAPAGASKSVTYRVEARLASPCTAV